MYRNTKVRVAAALLALGSATLAACGSSSGSSGTASSGGGGEQVKLTVTTWGEFGYEDLLKKFEQENPTIKVEQRKAANGEAARDANNTYLAAGSGLGDVVAVESGWVAQMMQYPDKWVPVPDDLKSRWLPWKSAPVTDQGGVLRMYGVDAAPAGICFNKDLFAKAGLPTDRAAVAKLLTGGWDTYFSVGKQFTAKTGKPWTNAASAIAIAQIFGSEISFQDKSGSVVATTNPEVRKIYDTALAQIPDTANMPTFGDDWNKGLGQNAFATQVCPSWMLGVIKSAAPNSKSWDVADVFPGGGIYWGGSWLAVPTQSKHQAEAQKLASWLTAPEQQLAAFKKVGAFPSQVKALESPDLLATTDPYFQNAPSGKIFANRAKAISVFPYNGPQSSPIAIFFQDAVNRVEAKTSDAGASWTKFQSDVSSLT